MVELTHCERYFDFDTEVDRMICKVLKIRVGASLSAQIMLVAGGGLNPPSHDAHVDQNT